MLIDQITHEGIEEFLDELDTAVESYVENLHETSKECIISDGFQLEATIVSLADNQKQRLIISSNGTLCPERGGSDYITLELEINENVVARGLLSENMGIMKLPMGDMPILHFLTVSI